jgi:hypothetical protein
LNSKPYLEKCDAIEYSISSRRIQRELQEKRNITASTVTISRSLKAFLFVCKLIEGRDYEIRGSPRKYIFEKLEKKKINEMNMKFKYNEN